MKDREQWIMSQLWRHGDAGSIVCDPHPDEAVELTNSGHIKFYGGLCVLESCPKAVRDYLIAMHNPVVEFQALVMKKYGLRVLESCLHVTPASEEDSQ